MGIQGKKIRIYDTTLRDGEQAPGISFTLEQKLAIARQLAKLGVEIIEAGTPVTSEGEREAVRLISDDDYIRSRSKVCGLARIVRADMDACLGCNVDMVHVFVSTSDIQIKHTIKMSKEKILRTSVDCVKYVKEHDTLCLFSAMDATRSDPKYLLKIYKAVEDAGADVINIPDTVGVMNPTKMKALVEPICRAVKIPVDVHCHNDFGLATANTLAAVEAGASQVQVTVNGIGERAGNASLEEVVMSLHSIYGAKTDLQLKYLVETSKLVERFTGLRILPNTPIVGENAFSHKSGIHVHGVLEKSDTFEPGIMTPEMVGHRRRITLGKHTGRHGVQKKLDDMGIEVTDEQLGEILSKVKELGDKGKILTDADLYTLAEVVAGRMPKEERTVVLEEVSVMTGNRVTPTAVVRAKVRGEQRTGSGTGVGPVDAALKAVQQTIGDFHVELTEFRIDAITGGSNALADVTIGIADKNGRSVTARAAAEDIVMASVEALIHAINRLMARRK